LQTATEERIIRPAKNVYGSLRLPGDKSISHRYGMLAAFAEGTSRLTNFSTGADCALTLNCMEALGAKVRQLAPPSPRRRKCFRDGPGFFRLPFRRCADQGGDNSRIATQ
jgi:5-enolpyruvylshikimate-3-phosphate synthase